jgi:hypothetical protein
MNSTYSQVSFWCNIYIEKGNPDKIKPETKLYSFHTLKSQKCKRYDVHIHSSGRQLYMFNRSPKKTMFIRRNIYGCSSIQSLMYTYVYGLPK